MANEKNIFNEDVGDLVKKLVAGLKKDGHKIDKSQADRIEEKILDVLEYQPRVGMLGKTGSGKSSLCNAIFGSDTAKIDDVKGCTRTPQEILVKFGYGKGIVLVDVPGVGENIERDKEYRELYKSLIPQLDLVVWVVKADDRALAIDELVVISSVRLTYEFMRRSQALARVTKQFILVPI